MMRGVLGLREPLPQAGIKFAVGTESLLVFLSLTPGFSPVRKPRQRRFNRFNGLSSTREAVETAE
jgi:hypothetical protein